MTGPAWAPLSGHVVVEDRAYISGAVGVHQFCRIGRLAMVGGHARVVQDVPPYLMVDGGSGCIEPTKETIADGTYPLSRSLYIYPNNAKAESSPALKAWVDFYLSDDGIKNVTDVGYVGLPADQLQATRDAWANH